MRGLMCADATVSRGSLSKKYGLSVRCVKDQ
jgi:hypothetical protein